MTDLTDAPTDPRVFALNDLVSLSERVRDFLNEQLKPFGLQCDDVHVNTVHDVINPKLTFTQTLHELGTDSLERGVVPTYSQNLSGVFAKSWTFEDAHRIHTLSVYQVEKIIQALLDEDKYQWRR